ncbi:MAG: hypothetical protein HY231_12555 [Acidobacteria bacterium]|nr:hypothetical protein [Acidobacteriota bacterium]
MKIRMPIWSFLIVLLVATSGLAAPQADFNGRWLMDRDQSEGMPQGLDQVMIIKQSGDQINLDTRVLPDDQLGYTQSDVYLVNGQMQDFTPRRGGVDGKGKRTAKWTDDGQGIAIVEAVWFDTPQGQLEMHITRNWRLSGDGKIITIEMTQKDQQGTTRTKRIFTKLQPT